MYIQVNLQLSIRLWCWDCPASPMTDVGFPNNITISFLVKPSLPAKQKEIKFIISWKLLYYDICTKRIDAYLLAFSSLNFTSISLLGGYRGKLDGSQA